MEPGKITSRRKRDKNLPKRNPHILPIEIIASSEIYVKNLRHYDLQLRQTNIKKSEEKM